MSYIYRFTFGLLICATLGTAQAQVHPQFIKEKLAILSGAVPFSYQGKDHFIKERYTIESKNLARLFLATEYRQLGYSVSFQNYGTGINLIAEKMGANKNKVLTVSSHMDTVATAGANDDGTGTIAALAIAQQLANAHLEYTLRFVAFDEEEKGLVGSRAYVKTLGQLEEEQMGDIHMEMMGTDSNKDGHFHVIDCSRAESQFLSQSVLQTIATHNLPISNNPACTDRSDHASFWKANIPAIVISEDFFGGDGDSCYHKSCDQLDERLDFQYMAHIATAITGAAAQILQAH